MLADGDRWLYVEGGGSHTVMACVTAHGAHERRADSTSIRSVTADQARAVLSALTRDTCRAAGADPQGCKAVVAAHGAASTPATGQEFADLLSSALNDAGVDCPVLVTNDLVPLLLGGPDSEAMVVVAAGTGTGFGARSAAGTWARASGYEYLLSDEGGGFDIGMAGLRAAVRAADGRGAATSLLHAAAQWCGGNPATVGADLSSIVYVDGFKLAVADFAPRVLDAAAHDEVAAHIVVRAARELAAGARAVARSAQCDLARTRILLAGSLLGGHQALASALRQELGAEASRARLEVLPAGWLHAGFRRLFRAWTSGDGTLSRAAEAFPVVTSVAF